MHSLDMSRAMTFGRSADAYHRSRPGYPRDAVAWLAPAPPARVADVGAGTGKLTASLIALGLTVDAVEPDVQMLTLLSRHNPAARAHCAPSDAIPVPDHSLEAVLVADAWHWFPLESTIAEVRRVLKPGGWLGLVWNLVTPVEPWEFEVAAIDPDQKGTTSSSEPAPLPTGEVETARFPFTWEVTPQHYVESLATNSAVILMAEAERANRLAAARAVLEKACEQSGQSKLPFQRSAFCVRWKPKWF